MLSKNWIIILILVVPLSIRAQIPGFYMKKGQKKIEIPFERQESFIVLKVLFQGLIPLRFILDTGAEHSILTKKEIAALLSVPFDREITIMGTDMRTQIKAYIARQIRLELTNLTLIKDIIVLDDDYFRFDEFAGLEIHGILGAEAFRGYVLKIDYYKQIVTIYDPSAFNEKEHRKYEEHSLEIIKSKPYIIANAQINNDSIIPLKLLLDTGASLALLLHTQSTPGLVMPQQVIKGNIGNGLGGEIEGYMGRLRSLSLGKAKLGNVISHFQQLFAEADSAYLNKRNGLIGGDILYRFNVIIDFSKEKAYFSPNRYFHDKFEYDKSGLILVAGGATLNQFTVYDVLPNSPAAEAGILRGDKIISVNFTPSRLMALSSINSKMQGKAGKKIRIVLKRDNVKYTKVFKLRNLI